MCSWTGARLHGNDVHSGKKQVEIASYFFNFYVYDDDELTIELSWFFISLHRHMMEFLFKKIYFYFSKLWQLLFKEQSIYWPWKTLIYFPSTLFYLIFSMCFNKFIYFRPFRRLSHHTHKRHRSRRHVFMIKIDIFYDLNI